MSIMLLNICCFPVLVQAQNDQYEAEKIFWENPDEVYVRNEDIAFTSQDFRQGKNEGIYFMSRFNEGWILMINLFHIKTNVFNKWGIYILVCEPDGKAYWETFEMDPKSVYNDTDRLYLSDGTNTIQGGNAIYYIDLNLKDTKCRLVFNNILDSWKAGDGIDYLSMDRKNYMIRILSSPWADVSGTLTLKGRVIDVKGQGYGEKSLIISPLTKQNPYLHAFRVFSDNSLPREKRWFVGLLTHRVRTASEPCIYRGSMWRMEINGFSPPTTTP
ncbi:MAG: hypothetical protein E4H36_07620 [Spirochaetales bacterium]|nr:MAG: hypothetical protein E4H36_07620 [Spirochaetales bacterium]